MVLKVADIPTVDLLTVAPIALFPSPLPGAPSPRLAIDEQPLAKNTQIHANFQFSLAFWKFVIFWILSALAVNEPALGFDDSLLHRF